MSSTSPKMLYEQVSDKKNKQTKKKNTKRTEFKYLVY